MSEAVQNPDESTDMPDDRDADALDVGREEGGASYVPVKAAKAARLKHVPDSSYENYLFGKGGAEDRPAWSDSIQGRAAIRIASRGIVGSIFFAVGGRMARSQLATYNEAEWQWNSSKPLQTLAKGIDMTFGAGYKKLYKTAARITGAGEAAAAEAAESALTFRQSRTFTKFDKNGVPVLAPTPVGFYGPYLKQDKGRSYGSEVVSFTFDFAMASVGDASTRAVLRALDPNLKKSWILNDKGEEATRGEHHHISYSKWAQAALKSSWTIFSKNQGEDWFAGLTGYAFQMKFQSKLLNSAFMGKRAGGRNRFEGHELVFDESWNGGAYRKNAQGEIIGDYMLPGAIDLHARFVGYNWYTLMFREGYDHIGNALAQWKNDGFAIHAPHLPQHFNPLTAAGDAMGQSARYLTKSFIKANMYMNPAVVPFWFMRISQSKWRGRQYVEELPGQPMVLGDRTSVWSGKTNPYAAVHYANYPTDTLGEKFEKGFSQTLNAAGKWQFKTGKYAGKGVTWLDRKGLIPKSSGITELLTYDIRKGNEALAPKVLFNKGLRNFAHECTDAAYSYGPYMFAKQEFGLLVDDTKGDGNPGQMDTAIYDWMGAIASGKWNKFCASTKTMWKLGTHYEHEPSPQGTPVTLQPAIATPSTTVRAGDVTRVKIQPGRAATDFHNTENEADGTSWAQSVMGNSVNPAQIMHVGATRH